MIVHYPPYRQLQEALVAAGFVETAENLSLSGALAADATIAANVVCAIQGRSGVWADAYSEAYRIIDGRCSDKDRRLSRSLAYHPPGDRDTFVIIPVKRAAEEAAPFLVERVEELIGEVLPRYRYQAIKGTSEWELVEA